MNLNISFMQCCLHLPKPSKTTNLNPFFLCQSLYRLSSISSIQLYTVTLHLCFTATTWLQTTYSVENKCNRNTQSNIHFSELDQHLRTISSLTGTRCDLMQTWLTAHLIISDVFKLKIASIHENSRGNLSEVRKRAQLFWQLLKYLRVLHQTVEHFKYNPLPKKDRK